MKIVQINAVYRQGSTGRNTLEMHQYFRGLGYMSYVFCANEHIRNENVFKIGNSVDHKLHALFSRVIGKQAYFSKRSTRKLIKHLNNIQPDVVLLGNLHGNFINLPILLEWLTKSDVPTIVVLHDCWFFTGHCCHYTLDKCYKWHTECHDCSILNKYNKSLFFDQSRKIFRDKKRLFHAIPRLGVVGVSDWITSEATKSPIFSNASVIKRIYNWVDLNKFKPCKDSSLRDSLGISANAFVAIGVAQGWNNEKGLNVFIELAKKRKDIDIVLVGSIEEEIEELTNLHLCGVISDTHVLSKYYSMADVFISPSVQETFGKVAAEALACGTPIIVNNKTALPEIAAEVGFKVEDNNIDEIIASIEEIEGKYRLHNGKKDIIQACRESAERRFEMRHIIQQYLDLFSEISRK